MATRKPPFSVPLVDVATGLISRFWFDYLPNVLGTPALATLTYSASISVDASVAESFLIVATNGTAFTIGSPSNSVSGMVRTFTIRNASGGALGTITWNAVFKMPTFTAPANGFSRSVTFHFNGTNWVQRYQSAADVPN